MEPESIKLCEISQVMEEVGSRGNLESFPPLWSAGWEPGGFSLRSRAFSLGTQASFIGHHAPQKESLFTTNPKGHPPGKERSGSTPGWDRGPPPPWRPPWCPDGHDLLLVSLCVNPAFSSGCPLWVASGWAGWRERMNGHLSGRSP